MIDIESRVKALFAEAAEPKSKKQHFGARKISTIKAATGDRNHRAWKKKRAAGK